MIRAAIEHRLRRAWQRRGALAGLLWPLSLPYGALAALRRAVYRQGLARAERLPVPVIVVGNVVAGGAGKTPVALELVAYLLTRGWRPGIVSRGYGRRDEDCREVMPDADPHAVGDEPLLLRRRAGVPVFVARRRAEAGRAMLAAHPDCDILVCDDGLQHLPLARDVEIVVFDARGIGNGWLLPAGPLREPWPRATDLVLQTEAAAAPLALPPGAALFQAQRTLADTALRADGTHVPLAELRGQPLTALAGIARPETFFAMLRAAGLTLADTIALPDHCDFNHFPRRPNTAQPTICTEKDAVKLWPRQPDALAVPLRLDLPAAFYTALDERLALRGYHPGNGR
ncbi:MAG: tetraacyldisaccharide 4'-kinase [Burkholderiaceae bacterium]|jgi:tetraacyldisaccharide 4'-kinase|nr:tetraacyldisaccharide 4'-kinase [Burkholderiaceae bacterium]